MARAHDDRSSERTSESRSDDSPAARDGGPTDGSEAGRSPDTSALTSGKGAEAIERATAAIGSDDDEGA